MARRKSTLVRRLARRVATALRTRAAVTPGGSADEPACFLCVLGVCLPRRS
jgi:hypothetical protein